jgi:WXG100 family type VII secretion target
MAGNVERLDTISFGPTIQAYTNHISTFDSIRTGVTTITNNVTNTSNWRGKGRDAFLDDANKVRHNLQDITDIMTEMRDALQKAQDNYQTSDNAMASDFRG